MGLEDGLQMVKFSTVVCKNPAPAPAALLSIAMLECVRRDWKGGTGEAGLGIVTIGVHFVDS